MPRTMNDDPPPAVQKELERLTEKHNRSVSVEVITTLQQYIARHKEAAEKEGK
jgi:hypothetical protein